MRKQTRQELHKLVTYLKQWDKDGQKETTIKQLKETIHSLREEMQRKTKLFQSMKETKQQDHNTLDLFKQEIQNLEETVKRLQRNLGAKDQMVKDLKQKLDHLQQQYQTQSQELALLGGDPASVSAVNTSTAAAAGGDHNNLFLMSAPEMRSRIKELELDRNRQRIRIQALKDKIHEQEAAIASLEEEKKEQQLWKERFEKSQQTVTRKEQQVTSYQQKIESLEKQIQSLQQEALSHQVESEKKIRQLQRQIDVALKHQKEFEQESRLLRERLIAVNADQLAEERLTSERRASRTTNTNSSNNAAVPATSRSVHFSDDVKTSEAKEQKEQDDLDYLYPATSLPAVNTVNRSVLPAEIPSSLSASRSDLQDVMQAIGGPPVSAPTAANTNPESQTKANDLLQRLTGLSSILFSDAVPPHPVNPFPLSAASPSTSNVSTVSGNASGGVLETSSTSSSSLFTASRYNPDNSEQVVRPSETATAIERRLSALVNAALQSPPRNSSYK